MEKFTQRYHEICSKFWPIIPLSYIVGSGISYTKFRLFHFFALVYFVDIMLHFKKINIKKWELPLFLFFIWELLTIFWAADTNLSLKYLFCLGNGYVLIFLVGHYFNCSQDEIQKVLKVIFKFNFTLMGLGVLETLGVFRWPFNKYSPSFYSNNLTELLNFYNTDLNGLAYFKSLPAVFFWNSNDLCFYLISTLPFLLIVNIKEKWFKYFYLILVFWILLANTGRSTLLGFILFLIPAIYFSRKTKTFRNFLIGMLLSLFCVLIFASEINSLGLSRQNRFRSFAGAFLVYSNVELSSDVTKNIYITSSTAKRASYLHMAFDQFKGHYPQGIGAGNLLLKLDDNPPINVHNFWVEILVESGVIGFSLFLFWISSWLNEIRTLQNECTAVYLSVFITVPSALSVSSAVYQPGFWIPVLFVYMFVGIKREGIKSS